MCVEPWLYLHANSAPLGDMADSESWARQFWPVSQINSKKTFNRSFGKEIASLSRLWIFYQLNETRCRRTLWPIYLLDTKHNRYFFIVAQSVKMIQQQSLPFIWKLRVRFLVMVFVGKEYARQAQEVPVQTDHDVDHKFIDTFPPVPHTFCRALFWYALNDSFYAELFFFLGKKSLLRAQRARLCWEEAYVILDYCWAQLENAYYLPLCDVFDILGRLGRRFFAALLLTCTLIGSRRSSACPVWRWGCGSRRREVFAFELEQSTSPVVFLRQVRDHVKLQASENWQRRNVALRYVPTLLTCHILCVLQRLLHSKTWTTLRFGNTGQMWNFHRRFQPWDRGSKQRGVGAGGNRKLIVKTRDCAVIVDDTLIV